MGARPTELTVQGESVQSLYHDYIEARYLVNRRYQRKLVWAVDEKAMLIDSITRQLPIPLILLAESPGQGNALEVIDGLQRLNAIFSFIENEYAVDGGYFDLETLADSKYGKDEGTLVQKEPVLAREICNQVSNYRLPTSVYRAASDETVDEVFRRINSGGRHLSLQEIRQAGALSQLSDLVRTLSATVRGDATLGSVVPLAEMAKISITGRDLDYGVKVDDIFWVKNGILTAESVRESRDEELVLDLLLDSILERLPSSGPRYRDTAFGIDRQRAATAADVVESRISILGADEVRRRFLEVTDVFQAAFDAAGKSFNALVTTNSYPRGMPRYFHAMFVAVDALMHEDGMVPKSAAELAARLNGFWDTDLTIPAGGGDWGADRKQDLFAAVKAMLQTTFEQSTQELHVRARERAIEFEATLSMALTETAMLEFKQGFCRVNDAASFDEDAFTKVIRTATAMVNTRMDVSGVIVFGVADDEEDARAIHAHSGVAALERHGFFVTGTRHELSSLERSIDEMWRLLTEKIRAAPTDDDFKSALASSLEPFVYEEYLLWQVTPRSLGRLIPFADKFFERMGPQTIEIPVVRVPEVMRRFGQS